VDIESASKELYSKLRKYDEVVGIAICHTNGIQYIVVYLAKISNIILKKIPNIYKGNIVKTEITGRIMFQ
jgi:hypothetical protein